MYTLEKLNYAYDALEPFIDTKTVSIHHEKHHKAYLDRLNALLASIDYQGNEPLEQLVQKIDQFPLSIRDDIVYNAGGVLNHNLYFKNISPNRNTQPVGKLKDAINEKYGDFEKFKEEFKRKASLLVGSGYTFLVINHQKQLEILNFSNQETPYLYDLIPIMTIDLWEHAYYLNYQNRRNEYIDNFFAIVDFDVINQLYEENL